jgi:hypothetical protein
MELSMPYYQCEKCKRIRESAKELWQLSDAMCTGCFNRGTWVAYSGPIADAILKEEDEQHLILTNKYKALELAT